MVSHWGGVHYKVLPAALAYWRDTRTDETLSRSRKIMRVSHGDLSAYEVVPSALVCQECPLAIEIPLICDGGILRPHW